MDKNEITLREVTNDGQRIFLYYDAIAGMYMAFGFSAYYTTMVTNPYLSYSEELQMPVALLRREHILYLRQSLKKVEHIVKHYYEFELKTRIGEAGYSRWAEKLRAKH